MDAHQCDERYECVHFETADELVATLVPLPSLDTQSVAPAFIYRGHGNAEWPLVPSSLRRHRKQKETTVASANIWGERPPEATEQVFAEFHLLKEFIEACDKLAIALPGDSYDFRADWLDDQNGKVQRAYLTPDAWPWAGHYPLLAFAQHHGIPTQLLDWTSSALVAAYFAAASHVVEQDCTHLAIWALNTEYIHLHPRISVVRLAGANSERLGAQRGLFTLARHPMRRGEKLDLDKVTLADALGGENSSIARTSPLWKLTLPKGEAMRLLYLCHLMGVEAGSVYPDAVGAAASVLERAAWNRKDPATGGVPAIDREMGKAKQRSHKRREKE